MKGLTKTQLKEMIDVLTKNKGEEHLIFKSDVSAWFDMYADDYFIADDHYEFVLTRENPAWNDKRGKKGYPRKINL